MKRQDPSHDITVHERNPRGSTYGWGVTCWRGLIDKLHENDPETALAIGAGAARWDRGTAYVRDDVTVREGDEALGIGRHNLLAVLAERAESLGVRLEFGREITDESAVPGADLIVAADGVNSALRETHADHFGSRIRVGDNKYIWLGTDKPFASFTFAFVESAHGWIWCYGYPFSEDRATFLVECSPRTWAGLGLDRASETDTLALLERLFAGPLDGYRLIGRAQPGVAAPWLNFRTLTNRTWSRGNLVLLGDAAHTTHYSIGAGTTLALEDAIALAGALRPGDGTAPALARYERERRSAILPMQSAARYSAQWFENLPRYMGLAPEEMFALLGQRHSPLLPYVPPQLYYRIDRTAEQSEALRRLKRWLGPRVAGTLHARSRSSA
ncbi:FAD-binding monooxygenase [Streptomyces tsukubensis]|uniref:FAD-binding monooxygenase n=2 Tax=Streptomyces tsukubensis TaxID=83656 RepID=A0A1V4AEG1_9ACTN|nr:FAD-binding monooxygenase [Streptomyces tsukubensis]QFR98152.1 FAD-binding monooxygenase [Streptomyces tsukubensis]